MSRDNKQRADSQPHSLLTWSRRNLLKVTSAGVGTAALGGAGLAAASGDDDDNDDGGDNGSDGDGDDSDGHFLGDIVDPVFGYSLAEHETDDVSLDHTVKLKIKEGSGRHGDFPQEPDPEAPGSFLEIPAEFFFNPVGLHLMPDDLVHFRNVSHLHTVTAYHEKFGDEDHLPLPTRVPDGVPGFTSPPITEGESWVYEFSTKGVYDFFCFPHLGLGMVGRIVVFDPDEDDIDDDMFAAPEGELFPNDERVLTSEELQPENIVDTGSVRWGDLTLDS